MKQAFAFAAAFLVLVILIFSFGTARANPQTPYSPNTLPTDTPTETATETATATPTATETATATATTDICLIPPPKPTLVAPKNNAQLDSSTVTFRWKKSACNKRYRLVVKRGSPDGAKVFSKGSKQNRITGTFARGYTYYWSMRACTTADLCTWSKVRSFTIKQSQPVPTKTPTPVPGEPTATPVPPGNPPPQIANYQGDGAYLHDNPNELWRFDCAKDKDKWIGYLTGATIYNIALWYTPNEQIRYERMDFNLAQVVETATLNANSSGYISLTVNTGAWTPDHHYHLIFTGKSSGAVHCGHFDVRTANAPAHNDLDHSPAAVERVYEQAGLKPE